MTTERNIVSTEKGDYPDFKLWHSLESLVFVGIRYSVFGIWYLCSQQLRRRHPAVVIVVVN